MERTELKLKKNDRIYDEDYGYGTIHGWKNDFYYIVWDNDPDFYDLELDWVVEKYMMIH